MSHVPLEDFDLVVLLLLLVLIQVASLFSISVLMHRVVFSEMSASSQKLIGSSQSGRRGRFLTKTLLQISRKSWVSELSGFLDIFFFFFF